MNVRHGIVPTRLFARTWEQLADIFFNPSRVVRGSGINPIVAANGAFIPPTDNADQFAVHHERPAAVALTGVFAALMIARAKHV